MVPQKKQKASFCMVQKVNPEKSSVQSKKNIKINSVKLYMKEQNSFSEKNVFFDIINNKKGQKKKRNI